MSQEEDNQENKLLGELFKIYGENLKDPARDKQIQEKCLALLDLFKSITPYRTEACLDAGQAREYIDGEKAVLEQFSGHVDKCPDFCQKLVKFYQKQ